MQRIFHTQRNLFVKRLLSLLLAGALAGCNAPVVQDETIPFKGKTRDQMHYLADAQMNKGHLREASKTLAALEIMYPFDKDAEQTSLDLMYTQYRSGEKALAAVTAERFIRFYPQSKYLDYAYYIRGVSNFSVDHGLFQRYMPVNLATRDNEVARQAFDDFSVVVKRFPKSRYAADARKRMVYLRELFAQSDLAVAKFYFDRGGYLAAINRSNEVFLHYQNTHAAVQALRILAESYQKLGLKDEAAKAQRLLEENLKHPGRVETFGGSSSILVQRVTNWFND